MPETGRILIADDEEIFSDSLAANLRKEGYECDCAPDSSAAERLIREKEYDLLIADIRMPGNTNLEFISALPGICRGLPVIVVTAFPDVESARLSIQLPVAAYLTKPFDLEELLEHVRVLTNRSHLRAAITKTQRHLQHWLKELRDLETLVAEQHNNALSVTPDAFLNLTLHNNTSSLLNLKNLMEAFANNNQEQNVCHLLNCPREERLMEGIEDTLKVLERSKRHFKSRELGELRSRLEMLIERRPN